MPGPINTFIIYAREDKEVKRRILAHLNPFVKSYDLVLWHDEHLEAGQEWKPHIESRLEKTDLFLLLVSVDFMNSEFINQVEFKFAIDRHKANKSIVIPIIINYCQWDIDFNFPDYNFNLNELQVLPDQGMPIDDWKTPEQAYNNIAGGIRKVLETIKNERAQQDLRERQKLIEEENSRKAEEEEQIKKREEQERQKAEMETAQIKIKEVEQKRKAEEEKQKDEIVKIKQKLEEEQKQKDEKGKMSRENKQQDNSSTFSDLPNNKTEDTNDPAPKIPASLFYIFLKYRLVFIPIFFGVLGIALPAILRADEFDETYPLYTPILAILTSLLISLLIKGKWFARSGKLQMLIIIALFSFLLIAFFSHVDSYRKATFRFNAKTYVKGNAYTPRALQFKKEHPEMNEFRQLVSFIKGDDDISITKYWFWTESSINSNISRILYSYFIIIIFCVASLTVLLKILSLRYLHKHSSPSLAQVFRRIT